MKYIIEKLSLYSSEYSKEVLEYGVKVISFNILSVMVIIFTSYLLDSLLYGCIFVGSFGIIRVTIGGYHCKTIVTCLISYISLFLITLIFSVNDMFIICLKLMSPLMIVLLMYISKNQYFGLSYLISYMFFINDNEIFMPIFLSLLLGEVLYCINKTKET